MYKFGIIGTSCAGKTTLAHALVARLKSYGILADGLFSQDRKFSFDKQFLETEAAQNWMVTNLISREVDLVLHSDVHVYVSDRTPVDLFAYYAHQYDTELSRACWAYVKEWAKTYTTLYYLNPLPYQDDTKRPPDEFRLSVDAKLTSLLEEICNVKVLERHEVLVDILATIGHKKPSTKNTFTRNDAKALAKAFGHPVLVKDKLAVDMLSDTDIWVLVPNLLGHDVQSYRDYAKGLLGAYTPIDLNLAVDASTFDFDYYIET